MEADGLSRFTDAQDGGVHDDAVDELRAGAKHDHWIWFVFPQLRGLGTSELAERFGLDGLEEAADYLDHELLRARLLEASTVVREQLDSGSVRLSRLMGSELDAMKLVSSMTLFEHVARQGTGDDAAELADTALSILKVAADQGIPRCAFTVRAWGG
jgi:uncharacterized protein (DUF1810 family)